MFSGSGPGPQTADGCSVKLYRLIPYQGELEPFRSLFQPGIAVLELGSGFGRMTRRMLKWGATVTAVDNSPEMLTCVPPEAIKVCSAVEALVLPRTFRVAVLASNLVNHPILSVRQALLQAARRHLVFGGQLLVERQDPQWLVNAAVGPLGTVGDVSLFMESVSRSSAGVAACIRYQHGSATWRQSFEAAALGAQEIEVLLEQAGFGGHVWHGRRRRWVQSEAQ